MKNPQAFTLIELLIVVLILAILAAIALPNFLEFQTRAKVARVKTDLRTLATALEAYHADHNAYPPSMANQMHWKLKPLSTPIAYIESAYVEDPFPEHHWLFLDDRIYYSYHGRRRNGSTAWQDVHEVMWWMLLSPGPDLDFVSIGATLTRYRDNPDSELDNILGNIYDPTNGTVSAGDIYRPGGELDAAGRFFAPMFQ